MRAQIAHYTGIMLRQNAVGPRVWCRGLRLRARDNRVKGPLPRVVPVRAVDGERAVAAQFGEIGLSSALQAALEQMHIREATEVQGLAIPKLLARNDVLIASHTGSGKTLAFLLPIIHTLKEQEEVHGHKGRPRRPRAIVLSPTRELAEQTCSVAKQLGHIAKIRSTTVSAGVKCASSNCTALTDTPFAPQPSVQRRLLNAPVDIVVATPSGLLKKMREGGLAIGDVQFLVVDEADTMLDKGFGPELFELIKALKRRGTPLTTALASASMTRPVRALVAKAFPAMGSAETSTLHKGIAGSNHAFVPIQPPRDKMDALFQVLSSETGRRVMVFCNNIQSCRAVDYALSEGGLTTVCFHGEMPIPARKVAIARFTDPVAAAASEQPVLVCTDLAARGLDMPAPVHHVVNFDMPLNPVDYLHRSGRTARAGAAGAVTSLVQTALERNLAVRIEAALKSGQALDELSPLKEVRPAMQRDKTAKGSNHRKVKRAEQRARASPSRAAQGRRRGGGEGRAGAPRKGSGRDSQGGRPGAGRGRGTAGSSAGRTRARIKSAPARAGRR